MFYIIRFLLVWTIWFIFSDKKRWREIIPVCIFAMFLAVITDHLIHHYMLWEFIPHTYINELYDEWGIYFVVTYLFIQYLPNGKGYKEMIIYFIKWTTLAIIIEYIHLRLDRMQYYRWWNIYYSYVADWLLFFIFYKYYTIFKFKKLSNL